MMTKLDLIGLAIGVVAAFFVLLVFSDRTPSIKSWQDFLDSLSTKGGNIMLMFFALGGLMWFVHHIANDENVDQGVVSAAHDMMVGFGAALLAVLSGSSSRQQMADRIAGVPQPSSQKIDVAKVETVNVEAQKPPEAK